MITGGIGVFSKINHARRVDGGIVIFWRDAIGIARKRSGYMDLRCSFSRDTDKMEIQMHACLRCCIASMKPQWHSKGHTLSIIAYNSELYFFLYDAKIQSPGMAG